MAARGQEGWLDPASKRFIGAVVVAWIVLSVLNLFARPMEAAGLGDAREIPTLALAPDDGAPSGGGTMPAGFVPVPLVAASDDRSPGIRVDAMPFGPPDLSTIWGLSCQGSLVPLFLDANTGDLFALADADTVWPDGMLCQAYASGNRKYWVQFDINKVRFVVQGTPEFKPI